MIRGFLEDNTLNEIRNNLRTAFKNSGLQQSIDKRYLLQTAHCTVVRFRRRFTNKSEYLNILENYRDFDFGFCAADKMELVYNDWYLREKFVRVLYKFTLS